MVELERLQIEQNIHAWTSEVNRDRRQLLVVMQKIQNSYQSISEESIRIIAEDFQIQPAEVISLATFFTTFSASPKGKFAFKVCRGMACDLHNKEEFLELIQSKLGVQFGETSPDGLFGLEFSQCMGMCDQGPVLSVNNQVFPKITPQKLEAIISLYKQGQDTDEIHNRYASLPLWEGRSVTASYPVVPTGSVLSRFNTYSPEKLLDELIKTHILSENFPSQISSSTREKSAQRVVVCNTDLSQAGSFAERILLADHYGLFLEGLLAYAYLTSAQEGIIYLRPEYEGLYPVLASYLERLLDPIQEKADPFADGKRICGIDIRVSPGFVGGGVGKSVEIAVNSDRFSANGDVLQVDVQTLIEIGRFLENKNNLLETHTAAFSVSGNCDFPGIYELPSNASVLDLLEIVEGHNPKAVQVGGITGKFVLPTQFGNPILDGKNTRETGIIIYGPDTDLYDVAAKLLQYSVSESCGHCAPCREGSARLLDKFQAMEKSPRISALELNSIANCMQLASKCEFGQKVNTAFQSLIQCFPELI